MLEFFGEIIIFMTAMLAAASGIGGGGLFVPLFILFFNFSAKQAIALSNGSIFFNSATKYVMSYSAKNPLYPWQPQIDYNIAIIFNPMMLFGAFIGVFLNTIFPNIIILGLLCLTIIAAGWMSLTKGIALYKKETLLIKKNAAIAEEKKQADLAKGYADSDLVIKLQEPIAKNVFYTAQNG